MDTWVGATNRCQGGDACEGLTVYYQVASQLSLTFLEGGREDFLVQLAQLACTARLQKQCEDPEKCG